MINTQFLQWGKQNGFFRSIIRDVSMNKILLKEYLKQKYVKRKMEKFLEMNRYFQRRDLSASQVNGVHVRVSLYEGLETVPSRFLWFRVLVWLRFLLLVRSMDLSTWMLIVHSKEVVNLKYIVCCNIERCRNYAWNYCLVSSSYNQEQQFYHSSGDPSSIKGTTKYSCWS